MFTRQPLARAKFFGLSLGSLVLVLTHSEGAWAQQFLCPPFAPLANGQCNDSAGFSGAALASQALSSLSQTAVQESSEQATQKIKERREQEQASCAEGFSRINGACERNPGGAPEALAPAPPPTVVAVRSAKRTKAIKVKSARTHFEEPRRHEHQIASRRRGRVEEPETQVEVAPRKRRSVAAPNNAPAIRESSARISAGARPAPLVQTPSAAPGFGGVLFGAPVPIQPDGKFGVWFQGYGDYERRSASGGALIALGANPIQPFVPAQISVSSRTTSFGFQFGADFTTRGVFAPGDGLIVGALGGYSRSVLTLNSSSLTSNPALLGNGSNQTDASFTGGNFGLYATYFRGPFSADFIVKTDVFSLAENFSDNIAFTAPTRAGCAFSIDGCFFRSPFNFAWSGYDPIPVIDVNLVGNLNYRFTLQPGLWVEPTIGAQYVTTMYDGVKSARLGLADGQQVRLQGGARFGTDFRLGSVPTTLTITGLAYDDVLVAGGFIPSLGYAGDNLLARSNEGQVRGRGVVALNFNLGGGLSSFIQGEARGGYGLFGAGGKAGIRYNW